MAFMVITQNRPYENFKNLKGLAVDGRVGPSTMNALEKMETRYGGHGTALSHDGVPNKYSRVLTMQASAYSSQDLAMEIIRLRAVA